ncbi:MAG: enoyl-CoA hydratase-related protein, partial [Myxococcales bacterium]|nr:enoyl-CoA hydratase-related protein [Myxococcales bacterium]
NIRVSDEGAFTEIRMSRPERRNALSESHLRELLAATRAVGASAARGLIFAADGPVFSAGHDFGDMRERDLPGMRALLGVCGELMQLLPRLPQVVIAQVEGLATAAGCQLVASCDLAVAGTSARFAVPGGRGGWFCTTPGVALGRAVGRKHALEMLLTGEPIDAETACRWGLVNRVVPDPSVASETRALLALATRGSASSKALGKDAFHRQSDLELPAAYEYATEVMATASQTHDAQEGMAAFVEKRRPRFTGD